MSADDNYFESLPHYPSLPFRNHLRGTVNRCHSVTHSLTRPAYPFRISFVPCCDDDLHWMVLNFQFYFRSLHIHPQNRVGRRKARSRTKTRCWARKLNVQSRSRSRKRMKVEVVINITIAASFLSLSPFYLTPLHNPWVISFIPQLMTSRTRGDINSGESFSTFE